MKSKKEEETGIMPGVEINTSFEENIPQPVVMQQQAAVEQTAPKASKKVAAPQEELVNCLRNERVIVRFVPRPSAMVQNPKHILYGGMAETATRSFVVPKYASTGLYKNVLTDSEKAFLEYKLGLEHNALSIYKKENNFWDDSNESGVGRVVLHKQDNYFDLSNPMDYIKVKVLLANKNEIAPSLQALMENPKATYQFVVISENAEAKVSMSAMDIRKKCWMEYGKIEDDYDTLRVLVELLKGRPISSKTKIDALQKEIGDLMDAQPRMFLTAVTDNLLPTKVLIKKAVEAGLIGKRNDAYYLRSDNTPLCEMNEESTLNNAAKYISSVKRQELKYTLEAKLKQQ